MDNDSGLGQIGCLDPGTNQIKVYSLPAGQTAPKMLVASHGKICYAAQTPPSIGALDPAQVSATPLNVSPTSVKLTPAFLKLNKATSRTVKPSSTTPSWTVSSYISLNVPDGWNVFQMPDGSQPTGIAITNDGYVVDSLRQVLARFFLQPPAQVTACKLVDADGRLATTNDRTPVAGWTLYLTINGTRQQPGKITGTDGCAAWPNLTSGLTYGVEEDPGADWVALAGTSHSFGTSLPGGSYQYTFINFKNRSFIYLPFLRR